MNNLNYALEQHALWARNSKVGECANLEGANLEFADLECANLECANLREANLEFANLEFANLRGANLRGVNLEFANLRGANLRGANLELADLEGVRGDGRVIKSVHCFGYNIAFTDTVLQIGCEQHRIKDWFKFSDDVISEMDVGALEWWRGHKDIIKQIIEVANK